MSESDAELVERARGGDAAAFEALARRHWDAARAVALAALGHPADAEDACQDAFLVVLERLEECRHPDRFRAWLLRIARNRAHNLRRSRRRRAAAPLEDVHAATPAGATARPAELAETRRRLLDAMDGLTQLQREVLLLHDAEGWRHGEIAGLLGITEGSSRVHLHNARRRMRERLGESTNDA